MSLILMGVVLIAMAYPYLGFFSIILGFIMAASELTND